MRRNKAGNLFEFQRNGPITRPTGHIPDFSASIVKKTAQNNARVKTPRKLHAKKETDNVVDILFFIDLNRKNNIAEMRYVDASGKGVKSVDISCFNEMVNLIRADFSDNKLPLEPFSVLRKLKELDLSCNSISEFSYKSSELLCKDRRPWAELETLNLSYNYSSGFITELQNIPHLSKLCLAHNNIEFLPKNMMHFTCLTSLNLSGNKINSEENFFALSTVTPLSILILDDNDITTIPQLQFGFENLQELSLRNNKLEYLDDVSSLASYPALSSLNIANNPIILKSKVMKSFKDLIKDTEITIYVTDNPNKVVKRNLPPKVRTVAFDPLTLPSFTKQHNRAINKRPKEKEVQKTNDTLAEEEEFVIRDPLKGSNKKTGDNSFFLTSTGAMGEIKEEDEREKEIEFTEEENPNEIMSVWKEVPVVQLSERIPLSSSKRSEFNRLLQKLRFIANHPELRIKPSESPSSNVAPPSAKVVEDTSITKPYKNIQTQRKKNAPQSTLAARTEYTKTEVQQMLHSMADRINIVERDLNAADETGVRAVDIALEQKNFSTLQKQYESIRAELMNTLNSV